MNAIITFIGLSGVLLAALSFCAGVEAMHPQRRFNANEKLPDRSRAKYRQDVHEN